METQQSGKQFNFIGNDRYEVTVYHGSNVMEIKQLVKLSWWKKIFSTQEYGWERIYFGHDTPLKECIKFYDEALKRKS